MKKNIDLKANTYSLFKFQSQYATEQACEQALFQLKWPDGFRCPKCGASHYTVVHGRRLPLYQCTVCRHQTTAVAGTIMENSKLSLVKWFLALYFMAANKDGISAMAIAKYIDVTFRVLLHKIRCAMGERESIYKLGGSIEMDEAFFGGKTEGKRGKGSENKTEVAVALQLSADGHPPSLKMQVIPDAKGNNLLAFAEGNIIEGAHHGLGGKYLQRYLDEFCYRFDRRHGKKPVFIC